MSSRQRLSLIRINANNQSTFAHGFNKLRKTFQSMPSTLAFTLLLSLTVLTGSTFSQEKRPNVLFIIVDDQSPFDLKAYRPDSALQTPNIDRLAREGVVLDAAYQMGSWTGAVCTASRHMIMTGRTLWHARPKYSNKKKSQTSTTIAPAKLVENTLPSVFNRAGYDTMRTCKNGNSYGAANSQFTVRHDATRRGDTDATGSAWHAEQVLNYLNERQSSKDSDPFLIYFGFSHPHDTRDGKPELLAKYGATNHKDKKSLPSAHPDQPALPKNYLSAHPFNNTHLNVRDEVNVSGVWRNRDEATIRNEIGRQYACSENIDVQIGRVLEKLEAMGELDNTFIFYTSDHGMAIGRHGLQGKQNLYEHTWRVPMIVRGPGLPAGKRASGNVYLLDVLSTLCDLTGVETPATNEGLSFEPVLLGKANTVREVLYGAYTGGEKPGIRCVRKGDWKLLRYESEKDGSKTIQLFNLADNPLELLEQHRTPSVIKLTGVQPTKLQRNLADNPEHATKLAEMEQLLKSEMLRLNDPHRLSE